MLSPEIGNRAREIFAEYTAEEIYSTKRQEIQKKIRTHTEAMLGQSMMQRTEAGERIRRALPDIAATRCSIIYDTLVLGLELPATVNAAINRKIEQYYLVQEYGFRVEREKKESERKQIEANGIRDFQQTVTQGISDSYVRWRGIEATLQLAQSPNTKIVIIGSGKDGLPVILGNVDTPMQPNPARRRRSPAAAPRSRQQRSGAAAAGRARARRSWKRRRPAICRARPNGRRRPRCRARHRTSRRRGPPTRPTERHRRRDSARQARSAAAPAERAAHIWTWSEMQELISRTVGAGGSPAGPEPPPPMPGPTPRQAAESRRIRPPDRRHRRGRSARRRGHRTDRGNIRRPPWITAGRRDRLNSRDNIAVGAVRQPGFLALAQARYSCESGVRESPRASSVRSAGRL